MATNVPSRIDRAALDRILKRAAELQGGSGDVGESLTEEETVALGRDVGLPVELVRQALIEERVRIDIESEHGVLDRLMAPANQMAQRVVQGTPETILAALTQSLERTEMLVVQRSQADRATFEPMDQFARGMRRLAGVFRGGVRPYLDKAELVNCVVTPLESGFCHVALAASAHRARNGLLGGASTLMVIGAMLGAAAVLAGAALPFGIATFGVMVVAGLATMRSYRRRAQRIRLGLERALDDLERNPALPRSVASAPAPGSLARGVGQVVRDITTEVRKALDK